MLLKNPSLSQFYRYKEIQDCLESPAENLEAILKNALGFGQLQFNIFLPAN